MQALPAAVDSAPTPRIFVKQRTARSPIATASCSLACGSSIVLHAQTKFHLQRRR